MVAVDARHPLGMATVASCFENTYKLSKVNVNTFKILDRLNWFDLFGLFIIY